VGYPHILFDYTHVELGFVNYLSPVYSQVGGYFQVVPLSLLVFRVELSWLGYWPFFVDRAGYFGRSSPDDDYRNRALPAEAASTATGWNMNIVGVLRGRIPLGPVGLVFLDIVNYEYWRLGSEPYYVNLRRDMIVPRSAWILANEAVVALEVPLSGTLNLRVGGFDAFRCVPATEHRANLAGGIVMLHWPKARRARDLSPFVRVGVYSHHPFRRGTVAVLAGVTTSYELTRW
jgi:hypothetical protein